MTPREVQEFFVGEGRSIRGTGFYPPRSTFHPSPFRPSRRCRSGGLFAAMLAWGTRVSILKSLDALMTRMDHAPGSFVLQHEDSDLRVFDGFVHRTFQAEDARSFVQSLSGLMKAHGSLEDAMLAGWKDSQNPLGIAEALTGFHHVFMAKPGVAERTKNTRGQSI